MKSTYIVFTEPNAVDLFEEDVSSPEPGEVLCAAERSLISIGTELHCLRGVFDPGTNWAGWVRYPFRPGYSMSARVIAVGSGVQDVREGDRVGVAVPHQQLFRVGANRVQKLPDGVSYEDGAWLSLSNTTQLAVRRAELAMGETVGVVGLGMLGQLIVQYLWVCGARQIFAIDPVPGRAARALTRGATHALTMDATQARAEIEKLTLGRMLDAVFDVTGHPSALAPSTELLRKLGRVVLVGDTPTPSQQHLGPRVLSRSLAILAIHASMNPSEASPFNPWTGEETRALFMDYIVQGRMTVADLTTRRCSPADAPAVYADLLTDRSRDLGVIFDWSLLS